MRYWVAVAAVFAVCALTFGSAQTRTTRTTPLPRTANPILVVGAQANAWSAVAAGIGATSTALDSQWATFCSAFGNVSAATTISVQVSSDNTNWYTSTTSQVLAGAGNFGFHYSPGARYSRLITSAAATITATLACKG